MDKLEEFHYFTCPVYAVKKPEFLEPVRKISAQYLERSRARKKTKTPMTVMTGSFSHEPTVSDFSQYVSQTAWNILNAQGFNMDNLVTYFLEMWTQEHNYHSNMEKHLHGHGAQISAFYFLNVPQNGCKVIIHDPRDAKVITNLPEKEPNKVSPAAHQIIFTPEEGTLMFMNAWLPHSFTRNLNKQNSVRFVHMNLGVAQAPEQQKNVEVI